VLDELLAQGELVGVGPNPSLHGFEEVFVDLTRHAPTALVAGASAFEGTLAAGGGVGVVADLAFLLDGGETIGQRLAGWAEVAVVLGVVGEVLFGEEATLAVGGGVGLGDVRGYPNL